MCSGVTTQTGYTMSSNLTEMLSPTSITQRSSSGGVKIRGGQSTTVSDDELEATSVTYSQMSERMKSDRVPLTKPEEDHRRRTIIVEKKNGSYGFTLQSYGIHYKKVQEVEMITYVDYVEYDGPAFKAGMREGDVILSINGTDMEKSDHKTLVNFIKECDSYMRMVVLFEDCVRKVGLHMRYIQLHNILQNKMSELERICIRENELLHGKWKTHSLPARKKASSSSPVEGGDGTISPTDKDVKPLENFRPTLSTENVNVGKPKATIIPPPAQFMLAYHYLDPNCRYILRPSTSSSSGEYLVSIGPPSRSHSEYQSFIQKSGSNENNSMQSLPSGQQSTQSNPSPKNSSFATPISQSQQNISGVQEQVNTAAEMQARSQAEQHQQMKINRNVNGHFCNPCIRHSNKEKKENVDKDNVSLDAYDLASPCCEPQCVPTKRRVRHKEHHHKHKHRENKDRPQRPKSQSHIPPTPPTQRQSHPDKPHTHRSRYFDISSGLASHCSLHSCTSSDYGGVPAENSGASYSTSLSTDTLYWEPHSENSAGGVNAARPPSSSTKSNTVRHNYQPQFIQRYYPHAAQIQPAPPQGYHQHFVHKPKSWDNLTTKSFGGYGFGYGYLDTVGPKLTTIPKMSSQQQQQQQQQQAMPTQQQQQQQQQRNSVPRKSSFVRYSQYGEVENYAPPPTQFLHQITTTTMTTITAKSTENLIDANSESNIICDCLDVSQHQTGTPNQQPTPPSLKSIENREYYTNLSQPTMRINTNINNNNTNNNNNSNNNNNVVSTGTSTIINSRNVATTSEITRL